MSYDAIVQARYNATEKGKSRKRKWAANMTEEQKEKQRLVKKEYQRRRREKLKLAKQTDC